MANPTNNTSTACEEPVLIDYPENNTNDISTLDPGTAEFDSAPTHDNIEGINTNQIKNKVTDNGVAGQTSNEKFLIPCNFRWAKKAIYRTVQTTAYLF